MWNFDGMNRQIAIRRLLAIFMIAGLALAPFSRPVMAGMTADASTSVAAEDMSVSATADEMAGDMPCCMTKCLAGVSAAVFRPSFAASGQIAPLQNDFWPDGLDRPPPEHPPRTLV